MNLPLSGFSLSTGTNYWGLCQSILQGPKSLKKKKSFEECVVLILRGRALKQQLELHECSLNLFNPYPEVRVVSLGGPRAAAYPWTQS